jgi:hypothetical protein
LNPIQKQECTDVIDKNQPVTAQATKPDDNGLKQIKDIIPGALLASQQPGSVNRLTPNAQPVSLASLQVTHPRLRDAVQAAKAWAARKRDGYEDASLVLVGPNGTGKTHIARAILWSICYTVDGAQVAPVGKFFVGRVVMELLADGERVSALIPTGVRYGDASGKCPIVVLDDVGSEGNLAYVGAGNQELEIQARYFSVINHCYENKISLIITGSNNCGNLKAMAAYLGPRSWDRLNQMAPAGFMVDLSGAPSYRIAAGGRT